MPKDIKALNLNKAALTGFLFALPFIIMNFIVSLRLEPFYSLIGSFPIIRQSPIIPLLLLLLFPIGAFISIWPMFAKSESKKRKFYIINALLSVTLITFFAIVGTALGEELYRCEILNIPNCD